MTTRNADGKVRPVVQEIRALRHSASDPELATAGSGTRAARPTPTPRRALAVVVDVLAAGSAGWLVRGVLAPPNAAIEPVSSQGRTGVIGLRRAARRRRRRTPGPGHLGRSGTDNAVCDELSLAITAGQGVLDAGVGATGIDQTLTARDSVIAASSTVQTAMAQFQATPQG